MLRFRIIVACGIVALAMALSPRYAAAEQARYRYVPGGAGSGVTLQYAGGERLSLLGAVRRPDEGPPKATHVLTFTHPVSRQTVAVPAALPTSTPRIEYSFRRVTYNYGSYFVRFVFLPDGSVEVVYSSGLFRAL
jgi:hypothetical protein